MPDVKVTYDIWYNEDKMLSAAGATQRSRKGGKENSGTIETTVEKPNPPSAQVTRWSAQNHHRNKPAATQLARPPKPQHKGVGGDHQKTVLSA